MKNTETFYAKSREAWRKWLEKNHISKSKVALVIYKKHTGKPSTNHKDSMHEAICFGWIDTTIKRLDYERYIINYVKRTDKSKWSKNTLSYGKQIIKEGRMFPLGLKRYKEGLSKPTHDHDIPINPETPEDLIKELNKKQNKTAKENFYKLAPSYRRVYLRWLFRAKLAETREKRIKTIIERMKENKKSPM